jgi:N-acetylmuramoyl-L-alanine amidase CwlA
MVKVVQNLVSKSKYSIKCPYDMVPIGITVHNTANDASAMNEISYMISNDKEVSFHYAVDDKEIVQGLPLNRNGWHAGDGNGTGNRKTIAIEICYSKSGGARYVQAEENCVQLVAYLLKKYGLGVDRVKKHQDWSGKYCPHRILAENRWETFKNRIRVALNGGEPSPTPTPDPGPAGAFKKGDRVRINTAGHFPYYVADDVKKIYGIWQVREDLNAGGESRFEWKDNGIPEKFVDITNQYGKKVWNSDFIHVKKGSKFVFNRTFTISKTATDSGTKYYQLDAGLGDDYKFWVVGTYLYKI